MSKTSDLIKVVSLAWFAILTLSACGGGASTEGKQSDDGQVAAVESTDPDVLAFKESFWDTWSAKTRCGGCHYPGRQTPAFANGNDVVDSHRAAQTQVGGVLVANLASPNDSRMVTIVRAGHKPQACGGVSDNECANQIRDAIQAWNDATSGTTAVPQGVTLTAPPIYDAGNSKSFPASSANFGNILTLNSVSLDASLHDLLRTNCQTCHAFPTAQGATGSFAAADIDLAYLEAQQKMDLLIPANSRLVQRLSQDSHNCWSDPSAVEPDDCVYSSQEMENAIAAFAETITSSGVDSDLIISKALKLIPGEAIIATGGQRHASNQIALWEFKTGSGNVAYDTSKVTPKMPLTLVGDYDWVGGYGVRFRNGYAFAPNEKSIKLNNNIKARGEYSIEAWVIPSNVTQEDKNIISYSGSKTQRNFTVSQNKYNYRFQNRSNETDFNGDPFIKTKDASENLQAAQQHIVMTYDPVRGGRIYVNGVLTDHDPDINGNNAVDGKLDSWDDKLIFILANESGVQDQSRSWDGAFRMVAIHNRVLSDAQIDQNFKAGVGEKFFLLFSIGHIDGVPADSYIKVQVEQFDTYSYLFDNPVYVNLGNPAPAIDFPIAGMRIGINGKEAIIGQSFTHISDASGAVLNITSNNQEISRLGSVIELQQGSANDEFFLSFEALGNETNAYVVVNPDPAAQPSPEDLPAQSDIGVRTFSEVNATMSELTGVPTSNTAVFLTYSSLVQQLPSTEDITAFVPANIIGISQLAFEYCDQLVDNAPNIPTVCERDPAASSARECVFGNTLDVATPFGATEKVDVVNALYNRMIGISRSGAVLSSAPTRTEITDELINLPAAGTYPGNLVLRLLNDGSSTNDIAKATCTSVLGSAAMLIQ